MKSFLKNTGKHTFIFGLGNIITTGTSFLLLPVYLHYLTPYDYGILALLDIIALFFGSVILQGLPNSLLRSYSYDYLNKEVEQKEVVGSAYLYLLISPLFYYSLLYFLAPYISGFVFKSSNPVLLVRLIFLTGFFQVSTNITYAVMRANLQSKKMVTISVLSSILTICLNFYFVVILKMNVAGIVWGNLISSAIFFLVSPVLLRSYILWKISLGKLKEMLLFGWPLIPVALGIWVLASADRFFIEHFSTTSQLGLYSLGFKIAVTLNIFVLHPFQIAWPTIFYKQAKQKNATETFERFSLIYLLIAGGIGLCLILGAEPLVRLVAPKEFWGAHVVVPILVFSLIFGNDGLQQIINMGLFIKKKTQYLVFIIAVGAICNIGLNWIFVPLYGMIGAAIATLSSSIVMLILSYKISFKFYPIKLQMRRIGHLFALLLFIVVLNYCIFVDSLLWMVSIKLLLIIMFPGLLYLTRFFDHQEKDEIITIVHKLSLPVFRGFSAN